MEQRGLVETRVLVQKRRSVGDKSGGAERRSSFQFLLNRPFILGHYLKPGSLAKSIFESATDKNLIMEIGRVSI